MSMIGNFGLCAKSNYEGLVNSIRTDQFDAAEDWIRKICSELEDSAAAMENNGCSGEVYIAIFYYFETEFGFDVRENADLGKVGECWREITGDFDMAAFSEKEKTQFLSLADKIDYDKVTEFVNDFYQNDYGDAGQIACDIFFRNLRKLEADSVLIWHLF